MRTFKKQIRDLMQEIIYKHEDEVRVKKEEVVKILNSDHHDWARIGELANQINIILNKSALLYELLKAKKPKRVTGLEMADVMITQGSDTGHF